MPCFAEAAALLLALVISIATIATSIFFMHQAQTVPDQCYSHKGYQPPSDASLAKVVTEEEEKEITLQEAVYDPPDKGYQATIDESLAKGITEEQDSSDKGYQPPIEELMAKEINGVNEEGLDTVIVSHNLPFVETTPSKTALDYSPRDFEAAFWQNVAGKRKLFV